MYFDIDSGQETVLTEILHRGWNCGKAFFEATCAGQPPGPASATSGLGAGPISCTGMPGDAALSALACSLSLVPHRASANWRPTCTAPTPAHATCWPRPPRASARPWPRCSPACAPCPARAPTACCSSPRAPPAGSWRWTRWSGWALPRACRCGYSNAWRATRPASTRTRPATASPARWRAASTTACPPRARRRRRPPGWTGTACAHWRWHTASAPTTSARRCSAGATCWWATTTTGSMWARTGSRWPRTRAGAPRCWWTRRTT